MQITNYQNQPIPVGCIDVDPEQAILVPLAAVEWVQVNGDSADLYRSEQGEVYLVLGKCRKQPRYRQEWRIQPKPGRRVLLSVKGKFLLYGDPSPYEPVAPQFLAEASRWTPILWHQPENTPYAMNSCIVKVLAFQAKNPRCTNSTAELMNLRLTLGDLFLAWAQEFLDQHPGAGRVRFDYCRSRWVSIPELGMDILNPPFPYQGQELWVWPYCECYPARLAGTLLRRSLNRAGTWRDFHSCLAVLEMLGETEAMKRVVAHLGSVHFPRALEQLGFLEGFLSVDEKANSHKLTSEGP